MRIESRYKTHIKKKEVSLLPPLLFILAFMIVALIGTVNTISENTYAHCPEAMDGRECGHVILPVNPYDFERNSPEYWNAWCNATLGSKLACK